LADEDVANIDTNGIVRFVKSGIFGRMKRAAFLEREARFVVPVETNAVSDDFIAGEKLLVHGIIDCLFEEDGKIIIVDYKTDRINGNMDAVAASYKTQMDYYTIAARTLTGKAVAQRVLYFLTVGEEVSI
jgi:ATP-dependent helicase/nuclease subunit A